jgi:hypothetical protein
MEKLKKKNTIETSLNKKKLRNQLMKISNKEHNIFDFTSGSRDLL